jgi:hypothetical protein
VGVSEPLYKVLDAGQSCDGGTHAWSLPTKLPDGTWSPGHWHRMPTGTRIRTCQSGFHLTTDPRAWWRSGRTVYLAESDGERATPEGDKVACRKVRLLRPVTAADVACELGVAVLRGILSDELLYGYGDGYGDGSGDGYGSGSGYGYGSGYGSGYGDGYGYGSGYGDGYGDDIVEETP